PADVRMYTGADFAYPTTIRGDGDRHSDALLGIFDVIAPAASAALKALDRGDLDRYAEVLAPTLTLSRHVFGAPTRFYKTGVVFAAYLNGHQPHFRMIGGLESARSIVHLSEQLLLLDPAELLREPGLAAGPLGPVLAPAACRALPALPPSRCRGPREDTPRRSGWAPPPPHRSYIAQNTTQRDRLKAFASRATDQDLKTAMPAGWTVAGVLAHLAFWDQRI